MTPHSLPTLTLVDQGRAAFCLQVEPPQDAESMQRPLVELIEHLQACLDQPLVWFERSRNDLPPVRLVLNYDVLANLGPEVFRIEATPETLTLRASTLAGLEHAVHYFLEEAFGVRWLWPGPTGTVTPRAGRVTWPLGASCHEPAWQWRRLWVGGAFWDEDDAYVAELKYGHVSAGTLEEYFRWCRRNRLGGVNIADGHRWAEICSPLVYGQTHPEYFALVDGQRDIAYHDGKHGNQPCTSNPEVVKLVADYLKAQFRARPELDGFSIGVNDGAGYCECERCQEIDRRVAADVHQDDEFDRLTQEGPGVGKVKSQKAITDRMLTFANDVAQQVAQEFPNKLLLTLIYGPYRTPPRQVKLHPNVIASFCSMGFRHTEESVFETEMGIFQRLGGYAQRLGIYEYLVNGANGSLPRGVARTIARTLSRYHELGGRYYASQAGLDYAIDGFTYYYVARALWRTDASLEAVLADYCRSGFGPAAEAIQRYLTAFMDRWEEAWPKIATRSMDNLAGPLYPAAWRAQRRCELEEALRACAGDAGALARVRFLVDGLDFLDLLVTACEAALPVLGPDAANPSDEAVARAAATRDQLNRWIDAHRDGYWITAMWLDYQRYNRSGLLGRPMPAVAKA